MSIPRLHNPEEAIKKHIGVYTSVGSSPAVAAALAFAHPPPSMSQPAVAQPDRDVHYYRQRIAALVGELEHNAKEYRQAVAEFKSSGVWKEQYGTWGRTCRECIGISRQRGNELIRELTESYEEYNDKSGKPLSDTSEAHELEIRMKLPDPLADLEAQMARPVVHAGPAPRPQVEPPKAVLEAEPEPPKDKTPRDLIGYPIPAQLMERWNQRQEVQDRITAASRLRCALEEIAGKGHGNPLYGLYDWQGMIRTVGELQFHLSQCKPEVVCYECDGHFGKLKPTKGGDGIMRQCHACYDRGFLTQRDWDKYADTKLAIIKQKVEARLAKCKKNGN